MTGGGVRGLTRGKFRGKLYSQPQKPQSAIKKQWKGPEGGVVIRLKAGEHQTMRAAP